MILIIILLLLIGTAVIMLNSWLNIIGRVEDNIQVISPEEQSFDVEPGLAGDVTEAEEINWGDYEDLQDDALINIMLVGQDSRGDTRERSDAMMLCSINPETGKIAVISFLRDLYVQMPEGYSDNKMNAAYKFGGFPFLYEVMDTNFGITCDGGIEVNFESFKAIVDVIGGVDIDLTEEEAEIVGTNTAGVNHLDGEQALTYSRIRKLDSDFGRTDRQRTVMNAILEKVRNLGFTELFTLVRTCMEYSTTDMTNAEIIEIVTVILPFLQNLELQSYRIPTDDGYYLTTINRMSVLVPDLELCRKYLREDFLPLD